MKLNQVKSTQLRAWSFTGVAFSFLHFFFFNNTDADDAFSKLRGTDNCWKVTRDPTAPRLVLP